MSSGKRFLLGILLFVSSYSCADEIDTHAAINIVQSVIGQCEHQGMLACEPHLQGIDELFNYIRVFRQVLHLDKELRSFVTHKYPNAPKLPFKAFKASRYLAINVNLTTEQFASRVVEAKQVADGYDVVMDEPNGPVLKLRRKSDQWSMIFPPKSAKHFNHLKTLSAAGELKRSVLIYRMLEADLSEISKQELEQNINRDLAPLLVSIFGEHRFPELQKWSQKDVDEIIRFYSQFSNAEEMKLYIQKKKKTISAASAGADVANPLWAH
jgi:hypothetical protein